MSVKVPAIVYSRVSGYYNPVNNFNKGKKEEFSQRAKIKLPETIKKREATA